MRVWRLTKTRYVATAFDGEGARLYGARWNNPGTRVAYASSNSALAVLEVLVHLPGGGSLPGYSLIGATIPDALVENLAPSRLPKDWNVSPVPASAQAVGDEWISSQRSLALLVPSVIVAEGYNVLINPAHPDSAQLESDFIEPYDLDRRLVR